jgi:type IV pilus assembly protein PilV
MYMSSRTRARGFSLIEVLVALLVISIGLLGIAKMQGLVLSNTNGGRLRALAAIEAASLAASMDGERNYWGKLTTQLNITVLGTPGANSTTPGTSVITSSDTMQNATITCPALNTATMQVVPCTGGLTCTSTASPCTAQQMAAYDLQQWSGRLQQVLGATNSSIVCYVNPLPVNCQITINWAEETVNSNNSESGGTMASPSYTLFVNP